MQDSVILDARGQMCPMPIVNMARRIKELKPGQVLEVWADDEGAHADVPAWSQKTGHAFLGEEAAEGYTRYLVRKVG